MSSSPATSSPTFQSRKHKAWWILGAVALLSVFMSAITAVAYRQTDVHLVEMYTDFKTFGGQASAEQCIEKVIQWVPKCNGMKALCEGAVPRVMDSCLTGKNRVDECEALKNRPADAHFGFKECEARQLTRSLNKVCGNSYKALDLHCRGLGYLPASIEKYKK